MLVVVQVHVSIDQVGDDIVVSIDGAVDLASLGSLHDGLARAIRQHRGATLLVDLDAVSVLDVAGLGVLLGAAAAARDAGGDLEIVCTRPALCQQLVRTRLDRAITVRSSITST